MDVNQEIDRMFYSLLPEIDEAITAEMEADELDEDETGGEQDAHQGGRTEFFGDCGDAPLFDRTAVFTPVQGEVRRYAE